VGEDWTNWNSVVDGLQDMFDKSLDMLLCPEERSIVARATEAERDAAKAAIRAWVVARQTQITRLISLSDEDRGREIDREADRRVNERLAAKGKKKARAR
jgi:hypothetical protein